MSIIYDALNKAEKKNFHKKQSKKPGKWIIASGITVLILILSLSGILFKNKANVSQKKHYRKTSKRRPIKFKEKKYAPGKLVLEGIIYDKGVPTAIINGKVLKEGDEMSGIKVRKINKNSVCLINLQSNKEETLTF